MSTGGIYGELLEKTEHAIARGRDPRVFNGQDVARARMFAYAFRTQTIGLFHSVRRAVEKGLEAAKDDRLKRARDTVLMLQQLATWPVPEDFRAPLGPFWLYDRLVRRLIEELRDLRPFGGDFERLATALEELLRDVQASDGIWVGRADVVHPDRLFCVPGIRVEIQPVVYLEHVSWNVARLGPESVGQTMHKHALGVEIHLGFSPVHGYTILDGCAAEVREGYAMPIPAHVPHGFDTLREEVHLLPFIFGSAVYGGWGMFFDVEPVPTDTARLKKVPLESAEMNGSLYVERELERLRDYGPGGRTVLCPRERTRSAEAGALELTGLVVNGSWEETPAQDTLLFLWHGQVHLEIAGVSRLLQTGDHVGLPRGLKFSLEQQGRAVFLEARLVE